ncbi:Transposase, Mutator family [Haloechinothrix alba]|uniref:Mutator family transposase n=1 Tax=Haloechinothrix alba TaxID=664784 RepID=A0A238XRV8_9PSEU|nr:Transposase, Mutator family [Haloechinothrix alba]
MTVDAVTTTGASKNAADEAGVRAQERGLALTGPDGLLGQLTQTVLETALEAEMTEHLGHAKHADQPGREGTNVRNDSRAKTVVSDAAGAVEVAVP